MRTLFIILGLFLTTAASANTQTEDNFQFQARVKYSQKGAAETYFQISGFQLTLYKSNRIVKDDLALVVTPRPYFDNKLLMIVRVEKKVNGSWREVSTQKMKLTLGRTLHFMAGQQKNGELVDVHMKADGKMTSQNGVIHPKRKNPGNYRPTRV